MSGVGAGLGVIWAIIGLGYLLGKLSVLQPAAQEPLNRLVYVVGLPAIVVQTLATADIRALIGAPLLVAAGSALIAAAVTAALLARRFGRTTVLIAVMGGSLANAAYLGVPIAQYVLGDSSHVAPVILFQIGFLTPLLFTLADVFSPAATVRAGSIIKMVLGNPLLLAAVAGAALSLTGWRPPEPVWNVVEVLSGLAVPCILIAFGLSFVVPVVLVGLNMLGLIRGRTILKAWRWVVVLVALLAAMTTPGTDVLTMFYLMAPLLILFFAAVGICMWNDRRRDRREAQLAAGTGVDADQATSAEALRNL